MTPAAAPHVIAYLTSQYGRASDTFIRSEVRHLRALGHVVHTFSVRRPEESQSVSAEIRAEQRATTYLLDRGVAGLAAALLGALLHKPAAALAAARAAWKISQPGFAARLRHLAYLGEAAYLAKELRDRGVRHLHNHLAEASAVVAMLAARLAGVPWSLTVHGPYEFFRAEHWRLGEKIASTAFTVCISEFCRSQCMIFAQPPAWERLHLIRCGVEEAYLNDPPCDVPDVARFVCVGRLCAEKGQLLLVDAAQRLSARWPALEIVLVGDGPLRGAIERRIAELGVERHVRIAGWQGSAAVRAAVLGARAFVLPTFAEGLPVVLMEALALGRPVVTSWIAAIPELVEKGVNGWLTPPGSLDALVEALDEALTTPVERLSFMGRAGAARVAERHDPKRQAAQIAALIDSACSRHPRALPPDADH